MWNTWGSFFAKFTIFASAKPLIMTRIERITHMEGLLDKSTEVIARLEQALEDFAALQPDIAELEAYYSSPQWRKDFEADEAGKLPKDLKRGVLSEDGIYDLLTDYRCLQDQIRTTEYHEKTQRNPRLRPRRSDVRAPHPDLDVVGLRNA